jgi:hypothetical protein
MYVLLNYHLSTHLVYLTKIPTFHVKVLSLGLEMTLYSLAVINY